MTYIILLTVYLYMGVNLYCVKLITPFLYCTLHIFFFTFCFFLFLSPLFDLFLSSLFFYIFFFIFSFFFVFVFVLSPFQSNHSFCCFFFLSYILEISLLVVLNVLIHLNNSLLVVITYI